MENYESSQDAISEAKEIARLADSSAESPNRHISTLAEKLSVVGLGFISQIPLSIITSPPNLIELWLSLVLEASVSSGVAKATMKVLEKSYTGKRL